MWAREDWWWNFIFWVEVEEDWYKSENFNADPSNSAWLVIPFLVEVEHHLTIIVFEGNDGDDQEGEGCQVEDSEIGILFEQKVEPLPWKHHLEAEIETEDGDIAMVCACACSYGRDGR